MGRVNPPARLPAQAVERMLEQTIHNHIKWAKHHGHISGYCLVFADLDRFTSIAIVRSFGTECGSTLMFTFESSSRSIETTIPPADFSHLIRPPLDEHSPWQSARYPWVMHACLHVFACHVYMHTNSTVMGL